MNLAFEAFKDGINEYRQWIRQFSFNNVSGNSKFSNLPPVGKINSYPSIINQSLKLKIMKKKTKLGEGKWTEEKASKHKVEMFGILKNKG